MTDATFTNVTVRRDTLGAVEDLLALDSVDGSSGNGAALSFRTNSATEGLHLVLGRLSASRVDSQTVRLDLGVTRDPTVTSGDDVPPLLSLLSGAAGVGVVVGGSLNVSGAATLNSATLSGALSVGELATLGELAVTGNSTIGGVLSVTGSATLTGALQVGGAITPSTGNAESAGILFPKNPAGGLGDAAWIRYYPRAGEGTTLEIGTSNDVDDHIALVAPGNVGVGTTAPTHKFHVVAQDAVGLFESTGSQAYLRFTTREGLDNRVEITNRPGGRLALWTAGGGDALTIMRDGSVGIGTGGPRTPLHVLGRISTGLDFTSAGSITFFPPDGFAWFHIDNGPAGGRPIGRLRISHGGSPGQFELMTLMQNGAVGIGTNNPVARFHVIGNRIRLENSGRILDMRADGTALDLESLNADLFINNNGRAVYIRNLRSSSSRELKENIAQLSSQEALEAVADLEPVKFNYKAARDRETQLGFIAEDIPDLLATPDRKGVRPMDIVAVLTKVVQVQQHTIDRLTQRVAVLEQRT